MTDILTAIDRAADGLCPCGAPPRPGSAYCSPDCEPTHISRDTDTNGPGGVSSRHGVATPMRWRPDLVTAAPDDGLTLVSGPTQLHGYTRHTYNRDGTNLAHLRLDDGYRFVGTDVERPPSDAGQAAHTAYAERCHRAWQRLERELANPARLVEDDDPWADVMPQTAPLLPPVAPWSRLDWQRLCRNCGRRGSLVDRLDADVSETTEHFHAVTVARFQACPHCGHRYPGPPIERGIIRGTLNLRIMMRTRVNGHRYEVTRALDDGQLLTSRGMAAYLHEQWDLLAEELLARIDATRTAPPPEPPWQPVRPLAWRRRCPTCGHRAEPVSQRYADQIGESSDITLELNLPCDRCHAPYLGPTLTCTATHHYGPDRWAISLRAITGDRRYGISRLRLAEELTAEWMQSTWDSMEVDLLARCAAESGPPPGYPHIITATPPRPWSDSASNPLDDMRQFLARIRETPPVVLPEGFSPEFDLLAENDASPDHSGRDSPEIEAPTTSRDGILLRALEHRSNRNTGPAPAPLDPRRRRNR